jgi:hypothetical protein
MKQFFLYKKDLLCLFQKIVQGSSWCINPNVFITQCCGSGVKKELDPGWIRNKEFSLFNQNKKHRIPDLGPLHSYYFSLIQMFFYFLCSEGKYILSQ